MKATWDSTINFEYVAKANRFEDLMGIGEEREHAYKRLALLYHPDKNLGANSKKAEEAFKHISELYIGKSAPEVKIGKWTIRDPFCQGDLADLYITLEGHLFKIARQKSDNDLMEREAAALAILRDTKTIVDPRVHFVPKFFEKLTASTRRVNVLEYRPSYYTLEDIANRMKSGLDFRHCVWMMNRLLTTLCLAHERGIVHGAVVPSHLLYRPEDHDFVLVDWCYSAGSGQKIPAVVTKHKALYAPEVLKGQLAQPSMDVFMSAKTMYSVFHSAVPRRFLPVFEWALTGSPSSRPDTAVFQERWRQAAKDEYGEPKFVKLELPVH